MDSLMIIIWFIVIVLAAIIEINTMDLSSIWFTIGALVSFVLALIGLPEIMQIVIFIVVSVVLLFTIRPLARKYLQTEKISTNVDRLIGKVAICTKDINVGERGEVKIDGKYWMAISTSTKPIKADEKVEVLTIEGVKLVVLKLGSENE